MTADVRREIVSERTSERIDYLDAAKGVGILLIMWAHLSYLSNPVANFAGSFKIVVFYVIAGYLLSLRKNIDSKVYIGKRLKSLGMPYFGVSALVIVLSIIAELLRNNVSLTKIADKIWLTVSLRGISTLWFLPSLFLAELFFIYIVRRLNDKARIILMIVVPLVCCAVAVMYARIDMAGSELLLVRFLEYPFLTVIKSVVAIWFFSIGYYYLERLLQLPALGTVVLFGGGQFSTVAV